MAAELVMTASRISWQRVGSAEAGRAQTSSGDMMCSRYKGVALSDVAPPRAISNLTRVSHSTAKVVSRMRKSHSHRLARPCR